ncbi:MAG: glycoside hydrolase [Candidatus Zipacnadales bacterium]
MNRGLSLFMAISSATLCLGAEVENLDGHWRLENQTLRVVITEATGEITILDKRNDYTWRQAVLSESGETLIIPQVRTTITIDGDLNEWGRNPSFELTPNMTAHAKQVDGARDLSGVVYVMWNDRYLYLGADMRDEQHLFATGADSEWWGKDSLEFWINAHQFGVALDPPNPLIFADGKPKPSGENYQLVVKPSADGYQVEAAFAWHILDPSIAPIEVGKGVRFAFGVNDADASASREGQLYYPTSWVHSNPTTFARALFADFAGHVPESATSSAPVLRNVHRLPNGISYETTAPIGNSPVECTVTLTLPNSGADLLVETDVPDHSLNVPEFGPLRPFTLDSKQAFVAAARYCDGLLMDCDDMRWRGNRLATYSSLDMPWVALTDLERGYLLLAETPDDSVVSLEAFDIKGKPRLAPTLLWQNSKGQFRYPRRMMISFVDKGGYVAICKRYRAYAQEQGFLVTQREKQKIIPDIAKLAGAPDIWGAWGLEFCREAKAAGIDRMLVNWRGPAEDMQAIKELGYLISEYDNYVDIQDGPLGETNRAPLPASAIKNAKGESVQGWVTWDKKTVFMKLCPALAVEAARLKIVPLLQKYPFNARFLDVTTASGLLECYDEAHPLTREEYRHANEALAKYVMGLGLVLGGEHGRWYGVPYFSYWEGMQSGGFYSWPAGHVGVNIPQTREEIGADYLQYGIGHVYRVPLWELCFHDCVVSTWYWGDSTGHLYTAAPELAAKQDAFNVLYGTVPLYWVNRPYSFDWRKPELRERLLESYRNTCKLHEQIAFEEMLSHEFVTEDHAVQKTVFADGTEVWVNFGDKTWTLERDGEVYPLPQYGFYAQGPRIKQYRIVHQDDVTTYIHTPDYLFVQGEVPSVVEMPSDASIILRREGPGLIRVIGQLDQEARLNLRALWPDAGLGPWRLLKLDTDGKPREFGQVLVVKGKMVDLKLEGCHTALLVGPQALDGHPELRLEIVSPQGAINCQQGERLDLKAKVANLGRRKASKVKVTLEWFERIAGGTMPQDARTLAEATVDVPVNGEVPVSFSIDTRPYDGRHLIGLRAEAEGAQELCAADNLQRVEVFCRPDLSLWDKSIEATIEMAGLARRKPIVRMSFDADAEWAALAKAGKPDPSSIRVEIVGEAPIEQRWCLCQYVDAGPDHRELLWQLPGEYASDEIVACRIHLDGLDTPPSHAPLPQVGWLPNNSGYQGALYSVRFGEGYIRGLTVHYTNPVTQILGNLGVSSADTGWVDEVGEVESFQLLHDGPVLTQVVVKKHLRGGHEYEKLYSFYPQHFEVTTLSPERFGTLSRAYYTVACQFEDDKGNRAQIDGKGEAENVAGKNPQPKWYATWPVGVDPILWALSCVAVTPHDQLTYWDAGNWAGVGFETHNSEPPTVAYCLHIPREETDFSPPTFAAKDYDCLQKPLLVKRR